MLPKSERGCLLHSLTSWCMHILVGAGMHAPFQVLDASGRFYMSTEILLQTEISILSGSLNKISITEILLANGISAHKQNFCFCKDTPLRPAKSLNWPVTWEGYVVGRSKFYIWIELLPGGQCQHVGVRRYMLSARWAVNLLGCRSYRSRGRRAELGQKRVEVGGKGGLVCFAGWQTRIGLQEC